MATIPQSPTTDFTSTTLDGSINDSVTTIAVNDASTINTPTYAVIDREDNNGVATPNQREVVYIESKVGNNLTVTRGVDNSTNRAHNDSAKLEPLITVGFWDDMYDAFVVSHKTTGEIVSTSTATLSTIDARSLSLASVATVRQAVITNMISVSGASVVGLYPSGASGAVLTKNEDGMVFAPAAGTGGFNPTFWVPGSLASYANVGGMVPVPISFNGQFMVAQCATPASVASISATIMKNGAIYGVVAIPAAGTYASSASIASAALVAGDYLTMNINSTASMAGSLSVLLRAT